MFLRIFLLLSTKSFGQNSFFQHSSIIAFGTFVITINPHLLYGGIEWKIMTSKTLKQEAKNQTRLFFSKKRIFSFKISGWQLVRSPIAVLAFSGSARSGLRSEDPSSCRQSSSRQAACEPFYWCDLIRPYQTQSEFIRPWQTLSDSVRPYQALSDPVRPHQTLADLIRLRQTLSDLGKPYQTLSNLIRPWKNLIRPSQTLANLGEPYQTLANLIRPSQTLSDLVRPYQTLTDLIRPCQILSGGEMEGKLGSLQRILGDLNGNEISRSEQFNKNT